jgi:succinate dehydrogenase / fumarate reductase cytochrome b subunit
MTVSILNRFMGVGLATVGTLVFVGWLLALASGEEAYKNFMGLMTGSYYLGYVVAVGLTFAFFFHLCAGIRHFVMDAGAGFELNANKLWAWMTLIIAALLTAGTWLIILGKAL